MHSQYLHLCKIHLLARSKSPNIYFFQLLKQTFLVAELCGNGNEFSSTSSFGTSGSSMSQPSKVILDQSDIYSHILSPLLERASKDDFEEKPTSFKKVIAIVIEYLRSLEERQIPAQHFLHELLINLLVQSGQFYQLHQLLQVNFFETGVLICMIYDLNNGILLPKLF